MNNLLPAQAAAQFLSLFVYATLARWYAAPWLTRISRADALAPLLWIHVFRYVALQAFSAQRDGFPVSDHGLMDIVVGDVAGSVIALATLFALRYRSRLAIPLAWLLVIETAYDTVGNIHGGMQEHLLASAAQGVGQCAAMPRLSRRAAAVAQPRRRRPVVDYRHKSLLLSTTDLFNHQCR